MFQVQVQHLVEPYKMQMNVHAQDLNTGLYQERRAWLR